MEFSQPGVLLSLFNSIWNSAFFSVVKFLLGIYAVVLFMDIVMLLMLRGLGKDLSKTLYGADLPPAHRGKTMKRWAKLKERLEREEVSQWKVAVLEADSIVNEILEKAGLSGENMKERLEGALDSQIENKERLLWAHETRNKIIKDKSFVLDKEKAEEAVDIFEDFLRSWETL